MLRRQVPLSSLVLIVSLIAGCGGPAPTAQCVVGTYVLQKDRAVSLSLDGSRFRLVTHGDNVLGSYEYSNRAEEGDIPNSGRVDISPESGSISAVSRKAVYESIGANGDIRRFLDSMTERVGASWPLYQDPQGHIFIVLDSDLDSFLLLFEKAGCN